MNHVFKKLLEDTAPQFNKDVTDGVAKEIFRSIPAFLDDIIKSSIKSLNSTIDLQYLGYRRMNPQEEYNMMYGSKKNAVMYDIAMSDMYMLELRFSYDGVMMNRHLYLPYARPGNVMLTSGTKYHIIPVLSDTVISPSHREVFVRLLKDKLTFTSMTKNFIVDGVKTHGEVIHSQILRVNKNQITDNIGKPLLSPALYICAAYGIRDAMLMYCGTSDVIVTTGYTTDINTGEVTSTITDAMREKYTIYESTKLKPRGLKEYVYTPHDVKILVPNTIKNKNLVNNFIYGLIYTLDILPEHADDLIDIWDSKDIEQEKMYWKILIGRISYKNSFSIDRMAGDVVDHFTALEGYIDNLIKGKLADSGIYVNTFFDLLANILTNYNMWLINSREYNSDISNRYLDILYYILYDVIVGFNKILLGLNKRVGKKKISMEEIVKLWTDELSTKVLYRLVSSSKMSLAIQGVDNTTDTKYLKITSLLEDQSCGNGVRRSNKSPFPENTRVIRADDLLFGTLSFLGKRAPTPRKRINIYMQYNVASGRIIKPDYLIPALDKLALMIDGRLPENPDIIDEELDIA